MTKPQIVADDGSRLREFQQAVQRDQIRLVKMRAALETAAVAFDMLDPANHGQTSDGELANLITTASKAVSDALKEGT